jgi:hypothetical protein
MKLGDLHGERLRDFGGAGIARFVASVNLGGAFVLDSFSRAA